jgi:dihydrodiol dehydrogenase / D-xylose 1-dehydrogenase (NADP)
MSAENFRWGILGPGRIAYRFADGVRAVQGAEVYAVGSRSQERAASFAEFYGAPKAYGSYEALVDDPDVDAVYIATPHRYHYENTLLCLNAGKPVLCEKPFTVNAAQAKELFDLAHEENLFLMEGLWSRYFPLYQKVRQWVQDGEIGEIRVMTSTFGSNVPRLLDDRMLNHELAGGALLDMGVYPIAISQWIFGKNPVSFTATSLLGETAVDELTSVSLVYDDGAVSQFTCNMQAQSVNDAYVYGTKGYIHVHPPLWASTRASLVKEDQELTVSRPFRATGFEYEIEDAMRCMRLGLLESPVMTHADTLANMELMDKIRGQVGLKYSFE